MTGKVFVIEGMDGAGKRTQAEKLEKRLKAEGYPVMLVSFPNYESDSSALVKKYLGKAFESSRPYIDKLTFAKQMSSFYAVDRAATFSIPTEYDGKPLTQLIKEGLNIICDRYTTSNILHQTANIDRPDRYEYIDWIEELEFAHLGLPRPTKVIYLDVVAQLSMNNIKNRYNGEVKEDLLEDIKHLKDVEENKEMVVHYCGWTKVQCHDGHAMLPIEKIHEQIYRIIVQHL